MQRIHKGVDPKVLINEIMPIFESMEVYSKDELEAKLTTIAQDNERSVAYFDDTNGYEWLKWWP